MSLLPKLVVLDNAQKSEKPRDYLRYFPKAEECSPYVPFRARHLFVREHVLQFIWLGKGMNTTVILYIKNYLDNSFLRF